MDAHLSCPRGHRWPLPDADSRAGGAPLLVCPVCGPIAEARLAPVAASPEQPTVRIRAFTTASEPPCVPGYEILGEIGRGGMGVVYQARQLQLNRVVALKMVLLDCRGRPQEAARFLSEAEVIAALNHPNIVQVYEIGEVDGRPFFSLEFVEGGSLAQRLRETGPLPPRQAARLIRDLAYAVGAAHQQHVVHRDLKPANVLLAGMSHAPLGEYTPKITDFGLAKRRDGGLKTTAGFILGTPCYMAPEQAAGRAHEVGPVSDIYALGAILYECLTGRPPFQGDTAMGTLQQVLSEDPIAPRRINPQAPADLGTICLKCLQKEPRRRYAAAADLADDLGRYLDGRPVQARPAGAHERLVKWTRRRPAAAAFLGVSVVALTLLLVGGVWHTLQLSNALAATERARIDAQNERDISVRAKDLAEQRDRLLREYVYAAQVRQAHQLWGLAELRPMRELLAPYAAGGDPDPREFTWRYLRRLAHADRWTLEGNEADVYTVAYSPDGGRLAAAGRDGSVRIWDMATGRAVAVLKGHDDEANGAVFSPDGAALASVGDDGRILLWDVATASVRRRLQEGGDPVQTAAWSPSGRLLATAGRDGRIYLWDVDSGRELYTLSGHSQQVECVAFAPDGRTLASGGRDGGVYVWDLERKAVSQTLPTGGTAVQTVAWSRDGRRLAAACGDGTVRLYDADGWRARPPIAAHLGEVQGVAFSPDGRLLASCGNDHVVRLWDVETGATRNVLKGHGDRVWCVAFSPDGKTLASAGRDRVVKLWDPERRQEWENVPTEALSVRAVAPDPRGVLALGLPDGSVRLRPTRGDGPAELLPSQSASPVVTLAYSAGGRRLGVQTGDGVLAVWDMDERRPRVLRGPTPLTFAAISFSADGEVLAAQAADGSVQLWDAATGATRPPPVPVGRICTCVAFSPVEGLLAVALEYKHEVLLYDARTGTERRTLEGHRAAIRCLTFAPDGRTLATGSEDQTAKLWDVETGREKTGGLLGHADAVLTAAFSPDGRTIATGGADHAVKLWDATTGQELATLPTHSGRICALGFMPDGNALISAGDGSGPDEVRLWSAAGP